MEQTCAWHTPKQICFALDRFAVVHTVSGSPRWIITLAWKVKPMSLIASSSWSKDLRPYRNDEASIDMDLSFLSLLLLLFVVHHHAHFLKSTHGSSSAIKLQHTQHSGQKCLIRLMRQRGVWSPRDFSWVEGIHWPPTCNVNSFPPWM